SSKAIKPRARDMQIEKVYENVDSKISILNKLLKKFKLKPEEICFIGDDLVDLGLMKSVGFAVAVANACNEIKSCAHYITLQNGGNGAVREVAEIILKSKQKWEDIIKDYSNI
ncbi:MAG: HAD hydrolase family protein, partial [Candidatus Omnitrophica bacterium]|nr:HAD hydrolase family protein [Candidatus Omnitrophota bacterium]